ncbi:hypothetical protein ES703_47352 [subsurface metagenome]
MLDKTNLHQVEKASERILTIFRELKNRDPGLSKLLGRYMLGLLNYKGIEVEQIVDYLSEGGGKSMLAQSLEEIRREAIEEGIEKGIEEGIEKGHKDILEIAKRMLLEGFGVEKIAKLTGLSAEEIRKLKA